MNLKVHHNVSHQMKVGIHENSKWDVIHQSHLGKSMSHFSVCLDLMAPPAACSQALFVSGLTLVILPLQHHCFYSVSKSLVCCKMYFLFVMLSQSASGHLLH